MLISYIKYLFSSKTIFKVHSPFIFDLLKTVLKDEKDLNVFAPIEQLRKEMLKIRTQVNFNDLGAKQGTYRAKVKTIAGKSLIQPKYARLLYRFVKYFQPACIIELGTSLGISASYQYLAMNLGSMITIEGCCEITAIARENFKKLGYNGIRLIDSSFDDALSDGLTNIEKVTYIFVDGNHTREAALRYFEYFLTKHTNESVFVFDDIHWSKGMEEAWDIISNHDAVTATIDLYQIGIVLFKKELSRQNFIIRY